MFFKKIPTIVQQVYPEAWWNLPGKNEVFLSFDDGPSEYTGTLLDILSHHDCKATFFLSGANVKANSAFMDSISEGGHSIGQHGYDHLNGWRTKCDDYLKDVERAACCISTHYFRPPYGKLTRSQYLSLKEKYQIVMWDLMPGDFKEKSTSQSIKNSIVNNVKDGSIVVLHDSEQSACKVIDALPAIIEGIRKKGFQLKALPVVS